MENFKENMEISITEYLQANRDNTIKKILDLLDMSSIPHDQKKKVRKVILEEVNALYLASCKVLTWVQEDGNKDKKA